MDNDDNVVPIKLQPDSKHEYKGEITFRVPEYSDWRCDLFGTNGGLTFYAQKDQVPPLFWRFMQYLLVGNRWYKHPKGTTP